MKKTFPSSLRPFIWHFLRDYKVPVMLFLVLSMMVSFWMPFNSLLIKYIVDQLANVNSRSEALSLFWPSLLFILNFEIHNLALLGIDYMSYKYHPEIKHQIVSKTFKYVHNHSHHFFQENLSGRIANQINILTENIDRILRDISTHILQTLSLLIISFLNLYLVHPQFFYGLLAWVCVFASVGLWLSRHIIVFSAKHAKSEAVLSGQLVDSITTPNSVHIFVKSASQHSYLKSALASVNRAFKRKEWGLTKLHLFQGLSMTIMLGFMLYKLIELHLLNLVTIGDFTLILSLSIQVGSMTLWTIAQVDELKKAVGESKQSLKGLFVPLGIKDLPNAEDIQILKGKIVFSKVDFKSIDSNLVLNHKNISLYAGQTVGLIGYSGSGKTDFVNLILRLYDLNGGQIFIDKQDIKKATQKSLRSQIAIIPQSPALFQKSIMKNILYGRPNATDEEVIEAAKKAQAHEFIMSCQDGYNTLVGERGLKLSGDQRQRIAIARTILKNAPILILDDATSQLDPLSASDVQGSLQELMQDKTTLVITHSISTLLQMDRILVFDQGRIVQDGTHIELLKKRGLYKTLWNTQLDGFLPEDRP